MSVHSRVTVEILGFVSSWGLAEGVVACWETRELWSLQWDRLSHSHGNWAREIGQDPFVAVSFMLCCAALTTGPL